MVTHPHFDFDDWYEAQRKSSRPLYGRYIQSGPNVSLMPCVGCKPYWNRKPVLQSNGNGLCRQCSPIAWDKEFTKRGTLTLDKVDESKLSGDRLINYERLTLLHGQSG